VRKIGAFEAKTHFSALLLDAERGETIILTKKGKPVAQLGPLARSEKKLSAKAAMKSMLSARNTLGRASIRDLIEEGRRR
jgi:prevent-host-death family protein